MSLVLRCKKAKAKLKSSDSDRFLESRDENFDTSRAFLVISMILTHSFEMFYTPDYNRQFTDFVTVGFVFLVGFTTGTIYAKTVAEAPRKYFKKFAKRSAKLLGIFLVCNVVIFLLLPDRLSMLAVRSPASVMMSILLGLDQRIFGFDILIPIAITIFLSWFILSARSHRWTLPVAALLYVLFGFFERSATFNYFGIKFTLIGVLGTLTGKWVSGLEWRNAMRRLCASGANIGAGVFVLLYVPALWLLTEKSGEKIYFIHVLPTVAILYVIYLISMKLKFSSVVVFRVCFEPFSQYMLFAYLFHIAAINLLFLAIPRDGLDWTPTFLVFLAVMSCTVAACHFLKYLNNRWSFSQRMYNLAFK